MLHTTPNPRSAFDTIYGLGHNGDIQSRPINIDCMSMSELEIAIEHPALHTAIRRYAELRLTAMSHRLAGFVSLALDVDSRADSLYEAIPHHLRW